MIRLYSLDEKPTLSQLEVIAEAWAPHRSIASWYLWRSLEQKIVETEPSV
jgi:DNA-3-methyladenine glycosylase II